MHSSAGRYSARGFGAGFPARLGVHVEDLFMVSVVSHVSPGWILMPCADGIGVDSLIGAPAGPPFVFDVEYKTHPAVRHILRQDRAPHGSFAEAKAECHFVSTLAIGLFDASPPERSHARCMSRCRAGCFCCASMVALTSASNRRCCRGSWSALISGCHWTPTNHWRSGASVPSMTPSAA